MNLKKIVFSKHAQEQMPDRGITKEEVEATIVSGEKSRARLGRIAFRKNFAFEAIVEGALL